jgi:ribosomal protein S18 acetylase RimI-like enzyme
MTDRDLYDRGATTLVASWAQYATASPAAAVRRLPGVAVALFPDEPERSVFNNALIERKLSAADRAAAVDAMRAAYADAGIERYAAWVHESDAATRDELERRGFTFDSSTRAMGMELDAIRVPRPWGLDLSAPDWAEYLRAIEVPAGLLADADRDPFHVTVARADGRSAAGGLAFDLAGDCGIYNVGTLEPFRRRGLGTALTAHLLHDGRARGCRTASLQATAMAERVYAAVGFRDLGRFLEFVP